MKTKTTQPCESPSTSKLLHCEFPRATTDLPQVIGPLHPKPGLRCRAGGGQEPGFHTLKKRLITAWDRSDVGPLATIPPFCMA